MNIERFDQVWKIYSILIFDFKFYKKSKMGDY